ncbi:MAG: beta-aspartyl-peptidase (threonine type) [Myxococcota bacterium]
MPIALAVHGGAGLIRRDSLTPERKRACVSALDRALDAGMAVLNAGGSALDAVELAVVCLEESPLFNAGLGAVLTGNETVEHDAAIMCGHRRAAGGVAATTCIRNPIRAARHVLEHTRHVLLVGPGAEAVAAEAGLEAVDPTWFVLPERVAQVRRAVADDRFGMDHDSQDDDVYGTVGAVACDASGHLAAATSTGGMVNQTAGRVGDSPIIGAGTWAWDPTCAVSATGHGELFMVRHVAARISDWMDIGGLSMEAAAQRVLDELPPEAGGVIAVDRHGHVTLPFTSAGMFRGAEDRTGRRIAIW